MTAKIAKLSLEYFDGYCFLIHGKSVDLKHMHTKIYMSWTEITDKPCIKGQWPCSEPPLGLIKKQWECSLIRPKIKKLTGIVKKVIWEQGAHRISKGSREQLKSVKQRKEAEKSSENKGQNWKGADSKERWKGSNERSDRRKIEGVGKIRCNARLSREPRPPNRSSVLYCFIFTNYNGNCFITDLILSLVFRISMVTTGTHILVTAVTVITGNSSTFCWKTEQPSIYRYIRFAFMHL